MFPLYFVFTSSSDFLCINSPLLILGYMGCYIMLIIYNPATSERKKNTILIKNWKYNSQTFNSIIDKEYESIKIMYILTMLLLSILLNAIFTYSKTLSLI